MRSQLSVARAVAALVLFAAGGTLAPAACQAAKSPKQRGPIVSELEQRYAGLRAGERIPEDVHPFAENGKLAPTAAALFRRDLAHGGEPEREALVKALAAIGRRLDPLYCPGSTVLRDAEAVSLLVDPGLERSGPARDAALEVLLTSVPPGLLHGFGAQLAADLLARPDSTAWLVVAKAKPTEHRADILKLAATPAWSSEQSARIARAALGDAAVERELVDAFLAACDGEQKARLAKLLGYVGTPNAQRALAGEMRSDLVIEMPHVMRHSVRVDIVAALAFLFPDNPMLWDNAVLDDEGYARIERFCEQTFGTKWTKPRPPFLWIEGFPSDAEP
jgi:hypothetical protein